jgi:hypothetical protein
LHVGKVHAEAWKSPAEAVCDTPALGKGFRVEQGFSTFLARRNPESNFSYPEEPLPVKRSAGQKKLGEKFSYC